MFDETGVSVAARHTLALALPRGTSVYPASRWRVPYALPTSPAESRSGMFGGNSNWRGPVWFPMNFLLVDALQRFDYYYGEISR